MKTTKISLIVLASLALLSSATFVQVQQAVPAGVAAGFNAIREETLRADLTFLASDALQGRMSLQSGDEVAIQWIASEFVKAGLKPAANGSFLQPVELIEYRGTERKVTWRLSVAAAKSNGNFPTRLARIVRRSM